MQLDDLYDVMSEELLAENLVTNSMILFKSYHLWWESRKSKQETTRQSLHYFLLETR